MFIMDYDGKLRIGGCIKFIVLGHRLFLDDSKIKAILDRVVDPESACYHKFVPHSFATSCYGPDGYFTHEIAFKVVQIVKANLSDPRYLEYERWLNSYEGYSI